jgi:hypothetical protein
MPTDRENKASIALDRVLSSTKTRPHYEHGGG